MDHPAAENTRGSEDLKSYLAAIAFTHKGRDPRAGPLRDDLAIGWSEMSRRCARRTVIISRGSADPSGGVHGAEEGREAASDGGDHDDGPDFQPDVDDPARGGHRVGDG